MHRLMDGLMDGLVDGLVDRGWLVIDMNRLVSRLVVDGWLVDDGLRLVDGFRLVNHFRLVLLVVHLLELVVNNVVRASLLDSVASRLEIVVGWLGSGLVDGHGGRLDVVLVLVRVMVVVLGGPGLTVDGAPRLEAERLLLSVSVAGTVRLPLVGALVVGWPLVGWSLVVLLTAVSTVASITSLIATVVVARLLVLVGIVVNGSSTLLVTTMVV